MAYFILTSIFKKIGVKPSTPLTSADHSVIQLRTTEAIQKLGKKTSAKKIITFAQSSYSLKTLAVILEKPETDIGFQQKNKYDKKKII